MGHRVSNKWIIRFQVSRTMMEHYETVYYGDNPSEKDAELLEEYCQKRYMTGDCVQTGRGESVKEVGFLYCYQDDYDD